MLMKIRYHKSKFFRFNHQLLWQQQDQVACIHFPQVLMETELLPFIVKNQNKHS